MQSKSLDFLDGTIVEVSESSDRLNKLSAVHRLGLTGLALASDAHRVKTKGKSFKYVGTATERTALKFVESHGFIRDSLRKKWTQRGAITFSPQWKYRATLHDHPNFPDQVVFAVGAPEVLLEKSASWVGDTDEKEEVLTSEKRHEIQSHIKNLMSQGLRVLAVAAKKNVELTSLTHNDIAGLTFIGVLAINDPVRAEVPSVIRATLNAGVEVKLVTGDHPAVAKTVGREVGILSRDVVTSEEMESMSGIELREVIRQTNIFARVTPLDKQRLVRALQEEGHVVAMTGDGINDAVALREADIGVAMGSGTDIAKAASDLVLLEDSFPTIVAAIREGRVIRDNLRKVIAFLLATNSAEVAIFFASLLAGLPLPLLPAQILWINIVTDGTSDIALSLEPGEKDVMDRKPEDPKANLITMEMFSHIVSVGLIMTIAVMAVYWYLLENSMRDLDYVRTMLFSLLSLASLLSVWSFRSLTASIFKRGFFGNIWVPVSLCVSLGMHLLAVYFPPMQKFFGTVSLSLKDWSLLVGVAVVTLFIFDLRKIVISKIWQST